VAFKNVTCNANECEFSPVGLVFLKVVHDFMFDRNVHAGFLICALAPESRSTSSSIAKAQARARGETFRPNFPS
jgi:hypothetical protein